MFRTKGHTNKKSEDVKKSAGKVLDTKKDTPTRAKVKMKTNDWCFLVSVTLYLKIFQYLQLRRDRKEGHVHQNLLTMSGDLSI